MSFGRSLATVSSLTIVSRVGGFIRDSLTAVFLGAGPVADAFFVAQRLPNLFRSLFAEGAFSAAFVPLYTTEQERQGAEAAQQFAGQALMLLLATLIPFSVIIMIFMPQIMPLIAHGYEEGTEKYKLALTFSRITFPYLALISVTALQTGVLNARGRFGPGAAAPVAFNIVLVAALFASHYFGWDTGYTQAWAVTISGIVQCAWLAVSCYRARAAIPLVWPHLNEKTKNLLKRIGPGAIGAGVYQVNLLISQNIATGLSTGAVSYLYYADRLNQLPLGIVGIAVATTLLPVLSRHVEKGDHDKAHYYAGRAIEFCLILGLPAMVGLAILARPILHILFEHGQFTHDDMMQTVPVLRAYALGIPGFLLVKVFAAGFFARHDTKTPVKVAMVAMITNAVLSLLLAGVFSQIGLALATSIAATVNAALLGFLMTKKNIPVGNADTIKHSIKILLSVGVLTLVCGILMHYGWNMIPFTNYAQEIAYLAFMIGVSGAAYAVALQVTGAMRWRDALDMFKRRNNNIK